MDTAPRSPSPYPLPQRALPVRGEGFLCKGVMGIVGIRRTAPLLAFLPRIQTRTDSRLCGAMP